MMESDLAHALDRLAKMEELKRLEERLQSPGAAYLPEWTAALTRPSGTSNPLLSHEQVIELLQRLAARRDALIAELGWLA